MLFLVAIAAAAPRRALVLDAFLELEEKYGSPIFEGRAGYENDCRMEAERFDMIKKMGAKKMRKCIDRYKEKVQQLCDNDELSSEECQSLLDEVKNDMIGRCFKKKPTTENRCESCKKWEDADEKYIPGQEKYCLVCHNIVCKGDVEQLGIDVDVQQSGALSEEAIKITADVKPVKDGKEITLEAAKEEILGQLELREEEESKKFALEVAKGGLDDCMPDRIEELGGFKNFQKLLGSKKESKQKKLLKTPKNFVKQVVRACGAEGENMSVRKEDRFLAAWCCKCSKRLSEMLYEGKEVRTKFDPETGRCAAEPIDNEACPKAQSSSCRKSKKWAVNAASGRLYLNKCLAECAGVREDADKEVYEVKQPTIGKPKPPPETIDVAERTAPVVAVAQAFGLEKSMTEDEKVVSFASKGCKYEKEMYDTNPELWKPRLLACETGQNTVAICAMEEYSRLPGCSVLLMDHCAKKEMEEQLAEMLCDGSADLFDLAEAANVSPYQYCQKYPLCKAIADELRKECEGRGFKPGGELADGPVFSIIADDSVTTLNSVGDSGKLITVNGYIDNELITVNGYIGKDDPIDYGLLDDGIAASSAALRPMCDDPVLTVSQVCTDIQARRLDPKCDQVERCQARCEPGSRNYDPEDVEKCRNKCEGKHCCLEKEAKCLSCINGMSIGEFCAKNKGVRGCDGKEPVCPERMKWNDCGTPCPLKCGKERPEICMAPCVSGCECEDGLFLTPEGTCVKERECPIMMDRICCKAMTAQCLACAEGLYPREYCQLYPDTAGCKREPDSMDGNIGIIMDGSPIGTNGIDGICCKAMTAPCLACAEGVTPYEYCLKYPETIGCKSDCNDVCYDDEMKEKDDLECKACESGRPPKQICALFPKIKGCEDHLTCPEGMEWTERRPACPMKCGKTGRPSNPRCFDPIKPGCACKEDLLLTQEGTCVEKDECDEIEPPIMDGNRPRPCDGIEMCCPESHDCMQPKGAGINMCVGKGDSIVNPKPCNIIADGKPPIADGTMPRPEPCDCSSKETGCTANGSPLKQCGCYYQEGGREDYICYTVGTCKAEGAQTSNVVKGATWRLCDKNNPNNFD
jgi:hypothetical protein